MAYKVPYWVWRRLSPFLSLASYLYFTTLHFVFWILNAFRERQYVREPTDRLLLISATQAVRMIAGREITSSQLVEAYIHRIEQVNGAINAVVVKNFDNARRQAALVDEFIADNDDDVVQERVQAEPLLGVPFTMKDAIEVEGQIVTCGVFNRRDFKCEKSAEVVMRMQNAGAILMAITNVPEVCMWVESINKIYGRSKNPYDTRRMTGGSSGGEGALLGAAGSVIGIGSDIGGSIRMPSFFNGIFGMKTTPGVIPLAGHVPEPSGYKTEMLRIGPMCRFAEDLPLLIKVMGGDNAVKLNLDEPVVRKKLRVFYMEGISENPLIQPLDDEMRYALKRSVQFLERKYDLIAHRIDIPLAKHFMEFFMLSMSHDNTDPKFSKLMLCTNGTKGDVNCYQELLKFVIGKSNHTLAGIITGIIDGADPWTKEQKNELLYKRDRMKRQVRELLGNDGILLFPSWPCTAMYHNEPLLTPLNFGYTALWNALALPVVQCPLGLDSKGLPLGVQVIATNNNDRLLIAVAQDLEEGFNGWVPARRS
ncbi:unnamed protein product [Caenorhabditis auriculariae]|uniref:Amidase domain-containing protein n=1 Tax=Caenorhabditis auriculariae TaxID=2777116 RepID=A0A8S1HWB2_9PELO|nr:unnamed protein product [Caenorhabditis auriculariae]